MYIKKKVNYAFKYIMLVHPVKTQKISQINLLYGGNKMKQHKQTSQQIQDKRSLVWLEIFSDNRLINYPLACTSLATNATKTASR